MFVTNQEFCDKLNLKLPKDSGILFSYNAEMGFFIETTDGDPISTNFKKEELSDALYFYTLGFSDGQDVQC